MDDLWKQGAIMFSRLLWIGLAGCLLWLAVTGNIGKALACIVSPASLEVGFTHGPGNTNAT